MFIRAKYASHCPYCSKIVRVGQEVYWIPGSKSVHAACWEKEKRKKSKTG